MYLNFKKKNSDNDCLAPERRRASCGWDPKPRGLYIQRLTWYLLGARSWLSQPSQSRTTVVEGSCRASGLQPVMESKNASSALSEGKGSGRMNELGSKRAV